MNLTLLLPWFPIIIAVGVGGRLLDRPRATGLAIMCSLFWVVLLQGIYGSSVWAEPSRVISIVAGVAAIIAMGAWSGEMGSALREASLASSAANAASKEAKSSAKNKDTGASVVAEMLDQFDDWLEEHRSDLDPWPKFDEFARGLLYRSCKATHMRPFRLLCEGDELTPLRPTEPFSDVPQASAGNGLIRHVIATGRSYRSGCESAAGHMEALAAENEQSPAWCFAIRQGARTIGVVTVGHMGIDPSANSDLLDCVERVIAQFWTMLAEVSRSRSATLTDSVSKLLTREAFARVGSESLRDSYNAGEPVAVAVIALERMRNLCDSGKWELADLLVGEVGTLLHDRVRADDQLGRFDESRFVILLRRVDADLATLILEQLMGRLGEMLGNQSRWQASITARCGVVASGKQQPEMRSLVSQAVSLCHGARRENKAISCSAFSDVEASEVCG